MKAGFGIQFVIASLMGGLLFAKPEPQFRAILTKTMTTDSHPLVTEITLVSDGKVISCGTKHVPLHRIQATIAGDLRPPFTAHRKEILKSCGSGVRVDWTTQGKTRQICYSEMDFPAIDHLVRWCTSI